MENIKVRDLHEELLGSVQGRPKDGIIIESSPKETPKTDHKRKERESQSGNDIGRCSRNL